MTTIDKGDKMISKTKSIALFQFILILAPIISYAGPSGGAFAGRGYVRGPAVKGNENSEKLSTQITNVEYSGSGCPSQSVAVTLSPDSKALSLIFDDYKIEASTQTPSIRKNCTIKMTVKVPPGFYTEISSLDLRGYYFLPDGSNMQLKTDYNLAYTIPGTGIIGRGGTRPQNIVTNPVRGEALITGPADSDLILGSVNNEIIKVGCGLDFTLTHNSSILGQVNASATEDLLISLDSLDTHIDAKIQYNLNWKKCEPPKPRCIPGRMRCVL